MAVVYITTNKINGKQYIGSDSNNDSYYYGSGVNLKKAIKKYGKKNFSKRVIWEGKTKEVRKVEEWWCNWYDVENNQLYYNATNKGTGLPKGVSINKKPISQFTLLGKHIKDWDSTNDARKKLGIKTIHCCLHNQQKSAGGFLWCWKGEKPTKEYVDGRYNRKSQHVLQYNLDMNFIKEWKSSHQIQKTLNIDAATIKWSCEKGKKTNGYYFKYKL